MTILIPAYEPDLRLLILIEKLQAVCNFKIIVVDDGSGNAYSEIFKAVKAYGCTVLTHTTNQGKGRALKTGFRYILETGENEGVVCADSDGQHLPQDIIKISQAIKASKGHIILGCRRFTGNVPLRSRFGNTVTRMVYSFSTGQRIHDTQTGLRGFSPDMLDWLCSVPGERFEYEMKCLLEAEEEGYSFSEVDIHTVYHHNHSSHFRTLIDSAKVYFPILKFSASSLLSGLLDIALLLLIQSIYPNLLLAVVGARVCSSIFNYTLNKVFVFSKGNRTGFQSSLKKYFTLVLVITALNYALLHMINLRFGVPLFYAKLFTETILFLFSYLIQKRLVFKDPKGSSEPVMTSNDLSIISWRESN
ncbi:MAG: bifunctional glycosyltransferase family 2/GtrA family protein [Desulfitobacterium hafniense]|nr:bifunctional glycosyltransferase family 2/GtrA family protein [Desulfitobacterium hafniense]